MVDLQQRAYQPADAASVASLVNLIDDHAGGHGGRTGTRIDTMVSTLVGDVARDTALVFSPDGELVAAALVVGPPQGGYQIDCVGGVHPRWRGQGIGRRLLAMQLARAEAIHAATDPAKEWEAHVGVVTGDEDALRLFRRFDMTPLRYFMRMVAPTANLTALAIPEGLSARRYGPGDEERVYRAHVEAFEDHWGYQRRTFEVWMALSVGSEDFRPELSWLAFDGGELAGYVLSYRTVDADQLYIGHVATRRAWRRRGVAGGLLGKVIADARKAGYSTACLGVDAASLTGAVGVYEGVGFSVTYRAVACSRTLPALG